MAGGGNNKDQEKQIDLMGQNRILQQQINELQQELNDQMWATKKTNEGIKLLYKELERKNVELEKLSRTDVLTQLYNRRVFYEYLNMECPRCQRYERSMSLLYIDVDNFKNYNDKYGHGAGDIVLIKLADIFTSNLRKTDYAFRIGGEEFTILLLETAVHFAITPAERIRKQIETMKFYPQAKVNPEYYVHKTVSIGIAEYQTGQTIEEFVKEADQAMYKAKMTGKNRIWFKTLGRAS
ncbi:MAG: GGDEF domain-containing protein [Candidatus Omnitrophota bacterium]